MPRVSEISVSDPKIEKSLSIKQMDDEEENYRESKVTVRRRFKEFVVLQDCLRANNPGCILPPLPPATIHIRSSPSLLSTRQVLLQRYLENIRNHPYLQMDPTWWMFLEHENFLSMISEFKLNLNCIEASPDPKFISEGPNFTDSLEGRLEYFTKLTPRLEILKLAILELFTMQQQLSENMENLCKSLTNYLDANIDSGKHIKFIQLLNVLDQISEIFFANSEGQSDISNFVVVLDDYIRGVKEIEQAFSLKRSWRSVIYSLELQLIDKQTSILKSQNNDMRQNFDKNFALSENYIKVKEEKNKAVEIHQKICNSLSSELDRIDSHRMLEIEQCINNLLREILKRQNEIIEIWEHFLAANNESVTSLLGDESGNDGNLV